MPFLISFPPSLSDWNNINRHVKLSSRRDYRKAFLFRPFRRVLNEFRSYGFEYHECAGNELPFMVISIGRIARYTIFINKNNVRLSRRCSISFNRKMCDQIIDFFRWFRSLANKCVTLKATIDQMYGHVHHNFVHLRPTDNTKCWRNIINENFVDVETMKSSNWMCDSSIVPKSAKHRIYFRFMFERVSIRTANVRKK